jgi:hypothetical protein
MSLIRVRQRRKKDWVDYRKGSKPGKLLVALALVLGVIWYLGIGF